MTTLPPSYQENHVKFFDSLPPHFLSSLKQQVVVDQGWSPLSLVRMEMPAFHLIFFNDFTNLFMMVNFHTCIFFHVLTVSRLYTLSIRVCSSFSLRIVCGQQVLFICFLILTLLDLQEDCGILSLFSLGNADIRPQEYPGTIPTISYTLLKQTNTETELDMGL